MTCEVDWVVLTLDTAEGREFNETLGSVEGHVELRVSQRGLLAGGDVRFPTSSSAPLVSNDFDNGTIYIVINKNIDIIVSISINTVLQLLLLFSYMDDP